MGGWHAPPSIYREPASPIDVTPLPASGPFCRRRQWERHLIFAFNMGRQHFLKPNHLILSHPPTPPTAANPFASSLVSVKSAVSQTSSIPGFQDSYRARAVGDKIPGFKTSAGELDIHANSMRVAELCSLLHHFASQLGHRSRIPAAFSV